MIARATGQLGSNRQLAAVRPRSMLWQLTRVNPALSALSLICPVDAAHFAILCTNVVEESKK